MSFFVLHGKAKFLNFIAADNSSEAAKQGAAGAKPA
jgi:hypothetical protein